MKLLKRTRDKKPEESASAPEPTLEQRADPQSASMTDADADFYAQYMAQAIGAGVSAGEFLTVLKTFAPQEIERLADLGPEGVKAAFEEHPAAYSQLRALGERWDQWAAEVHRAAVEMSGRGGSLI